MSSLTESFPESSRPLSSVEALDPDELQKMNAYWRAANYLPVGQIYLYDNSLLREPLHPDHFKQLLRNKLIEHKQYIARYGDDMPEIRTWKWPY
jgi:phosphoketolase